MSKIIEYQTSIREIEKLTGLNFGSLRQHDTFQDGAERATGLKVKLENFDDLKLDSPVQNKHKKRVP
jgi:hypothetical protein